MEFIIIIMLAILIAAVLILCIISVKGSLKSGSRTQLEKNINESTRQSVKLLGDLLAQNQQNINSAQSAKFSQINSDIREMRSTLEQQLTGLYKSIGQMQSLASGVNDLKKVLSNVKTRGILGELQLGAILEEILAPEQYDRNVATVPGSRNVVEFAVKLPHEEEGFIYLPIDSKFPADAYMALQDAYDSGDPASVSAAAKELISRIKLFAKDIHTKYVEVPYTTDFAIMFLPFEGLYAEAVNRGLVETLQREYKINVAGPSTMAAMLNSLQMGFRTLALERRSSEVWELLGAVKTEFERFDAVLESTQKRLAMASDDLEKLIGVRTRAIERKLKNVEKMPSDDFFNK